MWSNIVHSHTRKHREAQEKELAGNQNRKTCGQIEKTRGCTSFSLYKTETLLEAIDIYFLKTVCIKKQYLGYIDWAGD